MSTCLPQPFVERIHALFPDNADMIIQSFDKKRDTSVRLNTLKTSKEEIEAFLKQQNILYKCVEGISDALIMSTISTREITMLPIYTEGKIYIQSLSSMLPVLVLDPQPGDEILDMAAAPGSKTTHIAAYTNNTANITANDIDRQRIYKLKSVIEHQGAQHIDITHIPGQMIWQKYPEKFDKVLLDAPCSMEGRFDSADARSYEHWSPRKVKNLARLQHWLLRSALSATKVGGVIIYATCTLSLEENEEVIQWLLEKENGAVVVEEIQLANIPWIDGIVTYGNHKLDPSISKTKRLVPTDLFEGFYIAKLRKIASTVPVREE